MPLPYVIEATQRVAVVTLSGRVTGADLAQAMQSIYADPAWHSGFNIIWDGLQITELIFERPDLADLIALQRSSSERAGAGRDVIVTTRVIDEMMANMYVTLVKHVRATSVASSMGEALAVLHHHDEMTARGATRYQPDRPARSSAE